MEHWISTDEAAKRLKTSRQNVVNWYNAGRLVGRRFPPLDQLALDARSVEQYRREHADD